jgi:hypothetical protein
VHLDIRITKDESNICYFHYNLLQTEKKSRKNILELLLDDFKNNLDDF